jgi:hypothetical protein
MLKRVLERMLAVHPAKADGPTFGTYGRCAYARGLGRNTVSEAISVNRYPESGSFPLHLDAIRGAVSSSNS